MMDDFLYLLLHLSFLRRWTRWRQDAGQVLHVPVDEEGCQEEEEVDDVNGIADYANVVENLEQDVAQVGGKEHPENPN